MQNLKKGKKVQIQMEEDDVKEEKNLTALERERALMTARRQLDREQNKLEQDLLREYREEKKVADKEIKRLEKKVLILEAQVANAPINLKEPPPAFVDKLKVMMQKVDKAAALRPHDVQLELEQIVAEASAMRRETILNTNIIEYCAHRMFDKEHLRTHFEKTSGPMIGVSIDKFLSVLSWYVWFNFHVRGVAGLIKVPIVWVAKGYKKSPIPALVGYLLEGAWALASVIFYGAKHHVAQWVSTLYKSYLRRPVLAPVALKVEPVAVRPGSASRKRTTGRRRRSRSTRGRKSQGLLFTIAMSRDYIRAF